MGLYSASQLICHYVLHQQPSKTLLLFMTGGGTDKLQVSCETKVLPKVPSLNNAIFIHSMALDKRLKKCFKY